MPKKARPVVVVVHEYAARSERELSQPRGARLEVLKDDTTGSGWLSVRALSDGAKGAFPKSYTAPAAEGGAGAGASEQSGKAGAASGPPAKREVVRAVASHVGGAGQLKLAVGDVLFVVERFPTGWLSCQRVTHAGDSASSSQQGRVPAEVLEDVPEAEVAAVLAAASGSSSSSSSSSSSAKGTESVSAGDVVRAKFAYAARSGRELALAVDDRVAVTEVVDANWLRGTLAGGDGSTGLVPRSYCEKVAVEEPQPTVAATAEGADGGGAPPPPPPEEPVLCRVRATAAFEGSRPGQLTLAVGDVIDVWDRGAKVGAGWWRGRLGPNVGIFPASYGTVIEEGASSPAASTTGDSAAQPAPSSSASSSSTSSSKVVEAGAPANSKAAVDDSVLRAEMASQQAEMIAALAELRGALAEERAAREAAQAETQAALKRVQADAASAATAAAGADAEAEAAARFSAEADALRAQLRDEIAQREALVTQVAELRSEVAAAAEAANGLGSKADDLATKDAVEAVAASVAQAQGQLTALTRQLGGHVSAAEEIAHVVERMDDLHGEREDLSRHVALLESNLEDAARRIGSLERTVKKRPPEFANLRPSLRPTPSSATSAVDDDKEEDAKEEPGEQ